MTYLRLSLKTGSAPSSFAWQNALSAWASSAASERTQTAIENGATDSRSAPLCSDSLIPPSAQNHGRLGKGCGTQNRPLLLDGIPEPCLCRGSELPRCNFGTWRKVYYMVQSILYGAIVSSDLTICHKLGSDALLHHHLRTTLSTILEQKKNRDIS